MAYNDFDIRKFEKDFIRTLYPPKPVYRHVEWRNGHKVYQRVGYWIPKHPTGNGDWIGGKYVYARRNSYLGLQLRTGDPEKFKRERRMLRFFRVLRRSTAWWDRPGKSFWKSVFGV